MHVIVINSQKGGSGKTTLTAHLAVAAQRATSGKVVLIDTDTQGTLSTWHEKREAELPERVEVPFEHIARGIQLLAERGVEYCFLDSVPSRSEENVTLFRLADLVVVPVRPSPADLWAASATVALLKRENVPFLFVLNQVKANAAITGQAAAALSHHGRVAETFIKDRVAYASAMIDGRTAIELAPKGPAAQECTALWNHVSACLPVNQEAAVA